jgi:hypothetical protein
MNDDLSKPKLIQTNVSDIATLALSSQQRQGLTNVRVENEA